MAPDQAPPVNEDCSGEWRTQYCAGHERHCMTILLLSDCYLEKPGFIWGQQTVLPLGEGKSLASSQQPLHLRTVSLALGSLRMIAELDKADCNPVGMPRRNNPSRCSQFLAHRNERMAVNSCCSSKLLVLGMVYYLATWNWVRFGYLKAGVVLAGLTL